VDTKEGIFFIIVIDASRSTYSPSPTPIHLMRVQIPPTSQTN